VIAGVMTSLSTDVDVSETASTQPSHAAAAAAARDERSF